MTNSCYCSACLCGHDTSVCSDAAADTAACCTRRRRDWYKKWTVRYVCSTLKQFIFILRIKVHLL